MAGGGSKKGERRGGKRRGSKNKATIERETQARLDQERVAELERMAAQGATAIGVANLAGKKLMKQIAFDLAELFAGLTAYYQPVPARDGTLTGNPNYNEAKFLQYATLAKDTAISAAAYQSPRYSAVVIGATVVTKVKVEGGMPDDFVPPMKDVTPAPEGDQPKRIEFAPGTIITAEDGPDATDGLTQPGSQSAA